ncbi:MAG: YggS family pyridoxal phosphate-dependent enzyme [Acidobacteria bacterium]|nr:YggS family pyridoxal phosphate-dependent enzyme [Acidobacteriota bacterium]
MAENGICARLREVEARVRAAEARSGRPAGSVTLCAVTKTFPAAAVAEAVAAGITDVGENRVQEADGKQPEVVALGASPRWHLIGHLQSNKARRAVQLFDVIQSVDSVALATRIVRCAEELDREVIAYVQVDLAHEATKTGAQADDVPAILEVLAAGSGRVRPAGLMTVPPYFEDPEDVRRYFEGLRLLRDGVLPGGGLSMGMSHDFEVAIEEGATLVRVGSAIFGQRNQNVIA